MPDDKALDSKDITELTPEIIRSFIKKTVMKNALPKEQKKQHAVLLMKIFEKGMTPKEAMGISDSELAQIYSYAYYLYSSGKFTEARELFKMLLTLEPKAGFAASLGVCFHRQQDYEGAVPFYMLAAWMDQEDPVPFFYAYDCYIKMNLEMPAAIMLTNVIFRAGDRPMYEHIKKQARLLLDELKKKIIPEEEFM